MGLCSREGREGGEGLVWGRWVAAERMGRGAQTLLPAPPFPPIVGVSAASCLSASRTCLAQPLGVANVALDNLAEGQVAALPAGQLALVGGRLQGDATPHCILRLTHLHEGEGVGSLQDAAWMALTHAHGLHVKQRAGGTHLHASLLSPYRVPYPYTCPWVDILDIQMLWLTGNW